MPPPSEWPTRVARSWPSAEQQVAQAGGEAAQRVVAAARPETPWPGRSGAITVWRRASGSITPRQFSAGAGHAVDQQQHRARRRPRGSRPRGRAASTVSAHLASCDGLGVGHALTVASAPRASSKHADPLPRFQYCRADGDADSRPGPPRGALIVVAVGLLACVAAALLSTDKASGEAAQLEWVQKKAAGGLQAGRRARRRRRRCS